MDPLLDLMRLLRPKATLFGGGPDASGDWGLAFRRRDDLLFCWIERGECQLIRPGRASSVLRQGDFLLVYTSEPFVLASDASIVPLDSEAAVAATRRVRLKLGSGAGRPVTLHAGKFVLQKANEHLLAGLFPPVVHLAADDESLGPVRTLLQMNEAEARNPGPASEYVVTRLVELVLVEILRTLPTRIGEEATGLLAGLVDAAIAPALVAMHGDVASGWTVEALARLCGVSRSRFAARFRTIVGMAPIDYLLKWRMALAKDELSLGTKSVGEIAFSIGFQSASAFTTAFTRSVGCSPTQFTGRQVRAASVPRATPG